jgi:hypothetical protein
MVPRAFHGDSSPVRIRLRMRTLEAALAQASLLGEGQVAEDSPVHRVIQS